MKLSCILPLLALATPAVASAQALQCAIPASIERPYPELPSAKEPVRNLPIGSYTLALTWAPEYCQAHRRDAGAQIECGGGNRFGFTLHGLWPDGIGAEWPQYCAATPILPVALLKQHLCSTPSPQLLQHEWSKHGTCMPGTPAEYFARSTGLYAKLRYPDVDGLSRKSQTAGDFASAFAAANPGLPATAIRVTANGKGWLDELWLCLDKSFAFEPCKPNSGGVPPGTTLKIWRGRQ